MSEAEAMLKELIASKALSGKLPLTLNDQTYYFDLSTVPVTTNLADVLAQAFQLARSGNVEDVLTEAENIRTNGKSLYAHAAIRLFLHQRAGRRAGG